MVNNPTFSYKSLSECRTEFNILFKQFNKRSGWYAQLEAFHQKINQQLPESHDSFKSELEKLCLQMKNWGVGASKTLTLLEPFVQSIPSNVEVAHFEQQLKEAVEEANRYRLERIQKDVQKQQLQLDQLDAEPLESESDHEKSENKNALNFPCEAKINRVKVSSSSSSSLVEDDYSTEEMTITLSLEEERESQNPSTPAIEGHLILDKLEEVVEIPPLSQPSFDTYESRREIFSPMFSHRQGMPSANLMDTPQNYDNSDNHYDSEDEQTPGDFLYRWFGI